MDEGHCRVEQPCPEGRSSPAEGGLRKDSAISHQEPLQVAEQGGLPAGSDNTCPCSAQVEVA